jgi:hypothetical protein
VPSMTPQMRAINDLRDLKFCALALITNFLTSMGCAARLRALETLTKKQGERMNL